MRIDSRSLRWTCRRLRATAILLVAAFPGTPARGDDWPFFRGPNYDGISRESNWRVDWDASPPQPLWDKDLGVGVSSFAVVGDRVLTMGNRDDQDSVWCLDANQGNVVWEFRYPCPFDAHNFEGGTQSTPTVDGSFVYTLSYAGHLHCLDLKSGNVIWKRHLVDDFQGRRSSWDYAGSVLVAGDRLIVDSGGEGLSTLALDKQTGEKLWGTGDDLPGYSSPIPFASGETPCVLVFKARALVAYELSTGRERWRIDWRTNYDVNASCPSVVEDRLFVSTGYGGRRARGAAFRLGQDSPIPLWTNDDIETKMNSAIVHDGHVYCVSERAGGQLMCVALEDGQTVWSETRFAKYGTLMMAADKLIILDEEGDLVVASASPQGYRELARAAGVIAGRCWVQPVLANGRIFVRNNLGHMVCLDVKR